MCVDAPFCPAPSLPPSAAAAPPPRAGHVRRARLQNLPAPGGAARRWVGGCGMAAGLSVLDCTWTAAQPPRQP